MEGKYIVQIATELNDSLDTTMLDLYRYLIWDLVTYDVYYGIATDTAARNYIF